VNKNRRVSELLANDFTDERWSKAAVKNAFVLLKQQKFEAAAAFFLLARRLDDAVNIIVRNMADYQLALFVSKLVEGDFGPCQKRVMVDYIIPMADIFNDPWLYILCKLVVDT